MVGQMQGAGIALGGGAMRSEPAAADAGDGAEEDGAGKQRSTTEEEHGRVASCDVDKPTCSKRRRRERIFKLLFIILRSEWRRGLEMKPRPLLIYCIILL